MTITPEYELLSRRPLSANSKVQTRIPVVDESEASGETAEAYQLFRDQFGRPEIPGILKCFSSSPPLLKSVMDLASTLIFSEGALGRRMKEMISTYVSVLNDCPYCVDSHGFFFCVHGGDEAVLQALFAGRMEDPAIHLRERTLLEFARKVTRESDKISDVDVVQLRGLGWNHAQIAECVHIAAMFACFNRVANAFGLASQNFLSLAPRPGEKKGTDDHDQSSV